MEKKINAKYSSILFYILKYLINRRFRSKERRVLVLGKYITTYNPN